MRILFATIAVAASIPIIWRYLHVALFTILIAVGLLSVSPARAAPSIPVGTTKAVSTSNQLYEDVLAASALRASTQRVARLYLESGAKWRPYRTEGALERETAEIEKSFAILRRSVFSGVKEKKDFERALSAVNSLWAELRSIIIQPYRQDKAQIVYDLSEQNYIYAAKITFLFEDALNSEVGYMVDLAGRLQSNSERIAKAAIHGIVSKTAGSAVDFATWKKEYADGLQELSASPLNNEYLQRNMRIGAAMWMAFETVVSSASAKSDLGQVLQISKSADGMWGLAESSRDTFVITLRETAEKGKAALRSGSRTKPSRWSS